MVLFLLCPECGREALTTNGNADIWCCQKCGHWEQFNSDIFIEIVTERRTKDKIVCPRCEQSMFVEPANAQPKYDWFCAMCSEWFHGPDLSVIITKGEAKCDLEE
jgi:ribosomal protein L37AE/L43A